MSSDFEADELIALAKYDIEKGNLEAGLGKLKSALSMANPPDEVYSMTARLYAQLKLFDRAQNLFQQYLEAHPEAIIEQFQLGMTFLDAGQNQQALVAWDKVLVNNPTYPPALFYKGLALAQSGDESQARKSLDILLKSAPTDNLYFGKAKELLLAIDRGQPAAQENPAAQTFSADAYKTEH